ncbi:hypothetical protein ACLSU7_17535 [Bdellovibrio sp. HCB185ZH]|uniref:hypothetical protein n=1 Tax=Bdellovibrio sp. HCB185ZH TaxID=3394235 RepID=UPI0039A4382E
MKLLNIFTAVCVAMSFSFAHAQEEVSKSSAKVPVATGKYVTGGVLASTLGFGIGHGVQGRYADKGWIFTATESAGLAMLIAGANTCKEETDAYGYKETKCSNGGLAVVGLGVLLGFHVWEIVDAWAGATPVDSGVKAYILPDPKAPGIGLAYSF